MWLNQVINFDKVDVFHIISKKIHVLLTYEHPIIWLDPLITCKRKFYYVWGLILLYFYLWDPCFIVFFHFYFSFFLIFFLSFSSFILDFFQTLYSEINLIATLVCLDENNIANTWITKIWIANTCVTKSSIASTCITKLCTTNTYITLVLQLSNFTVPSLQ